jgi:CRISPR/Cas system-associated exonuclease Cas4 (RecB family)
MKPISKSRFLEYLGCPKDAWFRLHRAESEEFVLEETEKKIMEQGNEVERVACGLKIFSGFVEVKTRGEEAGAEVDRLMAEKTAVIYQPTFVVDGFIIRCDFLVYNVETEKYDLYEVKATNSLKDGEKPHDHISDVAFQTIVLEKYGLEIGKKFIVHLNGEYVRGDELDIEKLFVAEEVTDQVADKKAVVEDKMQKAKEYLNQEAEPIDGCNCHLYGRSRHCATFKLSHPEVPEYGVHDLSRIGLSPAKLAELVQKKIYLLHEIEDVADLTPTQQNQIHTHKTDEVIINVKEIANILDNYTYPLYFFDYETFAPAIPIYKGYKPYQRIPIQFSLHVIDEKGGALRHLEFLQQENADPSETVAKKLEEYIDPAGTVIAWNDKFEKGVTTEIGERLPQYEAVLTRICNQMQDLMDIFSQQHYVHKDFKGKASIEKVMNVLLPEMSYDDMPYTGNAVGYAWWEHIVNEGAEPNDRERKLKLLLDYCKQDTFVMVEIFRILNETVNKE